MPFSRHTRNSTGSLLGGQCDKLASKWRVAPPGMTPPAPRSPANHCRGSGRERLEHSAMSIAALTTVSACLQLQLPGPPSNTPLLSAAGPSVCLLKVGLPAAGSSAHRSRGRGG